MRLRFAPTGDLLAATRECEATTFLHWYDNSADELAAEYGAYEADSVFVCASEGDEVIGFARLITPGPAGLKTMTDIAQPPWSVDPQACAQAAGIDLRASWDVATLGVRPGRGAAQRAAAIYHAVIVACQVNEVSTIVAILDERARRLMASAGLIFHTLPGTHTASYLGSAASTPCYAHFPAFTSNQQQIAPSAHLLITEGIGFVDVEPVDRSRFALAQPVS